jgi:hypothetical protein
MIFFVFALVSTSTSPATHYSLLTESAHMDREMLFLKDTPTHLTGELCLLTLDEVGPQSTSSDFFMTKFTFYGDQLASGFVAKKFSFK